MAILEYVWLDGYSEQNLRSKVRIVHEKFEGHLRDCPEWGFDGSSTEQAEGGDSDCILKPVRIYRNSLPSPSCTSHNYHIVFCEVMDRDGNPHVSNRRAALVEIAKRYSDQKMWFGVEQEYTLCDENGERPYKWPTKGQPAPQGRYYCGIGTDVALGRSIVEEHLAVCLNAELPMYGTNAEVMPSQWEFQLGPVDALKGADDLWIARFFLNRIAERHNATIKLHPKPMEGDWNGAGCHTNFSTAHMRNECSSEKIQEIVAALSVRADQHIEVYGNFNDRRLTGEHETCHISDFRAGESDRGAAIRIPPSMVKEGKGYLEDRRPAANIDPYEVFRVIMETVCPVYENEVVEI